MTSRLDRLFILIETGTTTATRRTAASQLASIVKSQPEQLLPLLNRLGLLLKSGSWETRIAAGVGVGVVLGEWMKSRNLAGGKGTTDDVPELTSGFSEIIKAEPIDFDTNQITKTTLDKSDMKEEILTDQIKTEPCILPTKCQASDVVNGEPHENKAEASSPKLSHLLSSLINPDQTKLLMSSEGSSFDRLPKLDSNHQKTALLKQLVGPELTGVIQLGDLIGDEDPSKSDRSPNAPDAVQEPQLSSREQNLAKRRAKRPMGSNNSHLQIEDKKPRDQSSRPAASNLKQWADYLLEDLFSQEWETRHGAATGLREFYKVVVDRKMENLDFLVSQSTSLLLLLSLDRFSDFVSDLLVAPVRETAGQCLGALFTGMSDDLMLEVMELLLAMLNVEVWEVRHGAALGLKYLLALRGATSSLVITSTFPVLLSKLSQDTNDDVVSVAASCLLPVTDHLTKSESASLIEVLWNGLRTLDDLSSSCVNIMGLLAGVVKHVEGLSTSDQLLPSLLSLLHPFLHHKSTLVRRSTLSTLQSLTHSSNSLSKIPPSTLQLTLRHLYQRAFLETGEELLESIYNVWRGLMDIDVETLAQAAGPMVVVWFYLAVVHPRVAVEAGASGFLNEPPADEKIFIANSSSPLQVTRTRFILSRMVAGVLKRMPDQSGVSQLVGSYLESMSGLQRSTAAVIMWFWNEEEKKQELSSNGKDLGDEAANPANSLSIENKAADINLTQTQSNFKYSTLANLTSYLTTTLTQPTAFEEVTTTFSRLQNEARDFLSTLKHYNIQVNLQAADFLTMEQVQYLGCEEVQSAIDGGKKGAKISGILTERRKVLWGLWEEAQEQWREINTTTLSTTASALISITTVQLPPKLNPLIKPLMDSIRTETNQIYQRHSARALVKLLGRLKQDGKEAAVGKVIGNLVQCAVGDEQIAGTEELPATPAKLGAKASLIELCHVWGASIKSSKLWQLSFIAVSGRGQGETPAQEITTALRLISFISPHLRPTSLLVQEFPSRLPEIMKLLQSQEHRLWAAKCLAVWAKLAVAQIMPTVAEDLVRMMKDTEQAEGAVEGLHEVVEELGLEILPWVAGLVVPVLGLMSSQCSSTRSLASMTFASLIRLLPLDSTLQDLSSSSPTSSDKHFLAQLLHPSSIPSYKVQVPINVQLRPYQVSGINWLRFLSIYGLHGILCDDMGLGKTLMCAVAVAEEVVQWRERHEGQPPNESPSLIICPPTLTGHWMYELQKFISSSFLNPLHYTGPPAERQRLQSKLSQHNVVIASYDIVRNDLEFFQRVQWNYCVLDEGHVIKNGKTKISTSIKSLRSLHRLILSGTPIQNNVLELWSLFDFLMPGFLGSEKQFNAKFGRAILAARDSKATEKEQEAGALAMEALHRQALPFLLRRLKEDVLKDLPPKITQDFFCDLSPLQAQLYEDFSRTRAARSLKDNLRHSEDYSHIFQALQYLRKVCNHPKLVLTQNHPQYATMMDKLGPGELDEIRQSGKLTALRQLLLSSSIDGTLTPSPHRALIFCQLKSMLDIVEHDLLKKHLPAVTYLRLDGSVPAGARHALVQKFNNDVTIDLLLLTTQVGGLGLNLTGADTVIFVEHDWNPMRDLQAMDRAHRIGQKRTVNVYRLITTATLEEKIMGLQKFKLMTANTVISGENAAMETMQTEQLLDLFTLDSSSSSSSPSTAVADKDQDSNALLGAYRTVLESVPELWEEKLYDEEYDLSTFIKGLGKK